MGGSAEVAVETSVTSGCCRVWKGDRQMEQRTECRAKVMFRGHKDVSSPFSPVLWLMRSPTLWGKIVSCLNLLDLRFHGQLSNY